jgi:hypothetical protein
MGLRGGLAENLGGPADLVSSPRIAERIVAHAVNMKYE